MNWKDIASKLAAIGLPLLGGAVGGPGGALIGKGIAAALGLGENATPEQTAATLGNVSGDQLVALRAIEADLAKEHIKADSASDAGQVELIKKDIEKGGVYQAGWRPAAAWTCVFGLIYTFGLRPLLPWVLTVTGVANVPPLPPIDTMELVVMLGGMLGLGGLRHRERMAGKA
jgi:hypothetical protein